MASKEEKEVTMSADTDADTAAADGTDTAAADGTDTAAATNAKPDDTDNTATKVEKKQDLMGAGRIFWEKLNGELYLSAMPKGPPPTNWIKYEEAKKTEAISFIKEQLSQKLDENIEPVEPVTVLSNVTDSLGTGAAAVTGALGTGAAAVTGALGTGVSALGTGASAVTDVLSSGTEAVTGALSTGTSAVTGAVGSTLNAINPLSYFGSKGGNKQSRRKINTKLGKRRTYKKTYLEKH